MKLVNGYTALELRNGIILLSVTKILAYSHLPEEI